MTGVAVWKRFPLRHEGQRPDLLSETHSTGDKECMVSVTLCGHGPRSLFLKLITQCYRELCIFHSPLIQFSYKCCEGKEHVCKY